MQIGAGVYRRNRRHVISTGEPAPTLPAEEAIADVLPSTDDKTGVAAQPEGPQPKELEPRRSKRAVKPTAWHKHYDINTRS